MRVSREQAAQTRRRIVETAGRLFRERGFDGVGVADIMRDAGLTHGGFYGHFGSKDSLAAEACAAGMDASAAKWTALAEQASAAPIDAIAAAYLSRRHRDNPGRGCLLPALGAEAARQSATVRRDFTDGLRDLVAILEPLTAGDSPAAQREKALATMAGLVGAMVLARGVDDSDLSDEILAAAEARLRQS